MQVNITALIKACEQAGYDYEFIDREKNFVRIRLGKTWQYFQGNRTPFNSAVFSNICQDKSHSYQLLHSVVNMPKTLSILDFAVEDNYKKYLTYPSMEATLQAIEAELQYPVIIKPNKGSLGRDVFLCEDKTSAKESIEHIFNKLAKHYDYMAVAQQFIPTQAEYRLLYLFGQPEFAYTRGNAAAFNAKYWEKGEQATLIKDQQLINELADFVRPIDAEIEAGIVGYDIIRGMDQQLYLIELNASPKFSHIIESSGDAELVTLFSKGLAILAAR